MNNRQFLQSVLLIYTDIGQAPPGGHVLIRTKEQQEVQPLDEYLEQPATLPNGDTIQSFSFIPSEPQEDTQEWELVVASKETGETDLFFASVKKDDLRDLISVDAWLAFVQEKLESSAISINM